MSTASQGFRSSRHASIAESRVSTISDRTMPQARLADLAEGSIESRETASTDFERRDGGRLDHQAQEDVSCPPFSSSSLYTVGVDVREELRRSEDRDSGSNPTQPRADM